MGKRSAFIHRTAAEAEQANGGTIMEMTLRPMTQAEQAYCYTQSHQICSHAGLIGHLRTDFGSSGTEFYSTFFDFRENLKSDDFKAEFDDVINALRRDPQYGGILKSRGAMSSYCYKHPPPVYCIYANKHNNCKCRYI